MVQKSSSDGAPFVAEHGATERRLAIVHARPARSLLLRDAGERPLHMLPCDLLMRHRLDDKVEVERRLRAGLLIMELYPRFRVVAPVR